MEDSDRTLPGDPADRSTARRLDEADPLSSFRDRFDLPDELYMDGNSLGPISDAAAATLERTVEEWRELGIRGWEDAERPWFRYGEHLGDRLAPYLGADPAEVVVTNSTTVNIHTLVGTFLDELLAGNTPDGSPIEEPPAVLVNELDFPTDHYAIRAQLRARGINPDEKLVLVESDDGRTIETDAIAEALDRRPDVGIVFLPTVLYRSGQLFDVAAIAELARDANAYVGFDAAHSIGVVPHAFDEAGVDFAVWCSYKYLNAGPGAIAGLYVADRHFGMTPALPGWWGHEKETQFEMNPTYTPARSAGAWQIGTVPILGAAPLEGALDVLEEAGIDAIRSKSIELTGYLIGLVDERLDDSFAVGTPRSPARRGGHVAVEHPDARSFSAALRDSGVIVDFRPPNVIRICPAPLYTRFVDVWSVVDRLLTIEAEGRHRSIDDRGDVV